MPGLRYTSQSPLQFSEGYLAFILCFCLCVFSLSPSVCVSVSVSPLPLSASLSVSVSVSLLPLSIFLSACLFVYLMSVFICLALCLASSRSVFNLHSYFVQTFLSVCACRLHLQFLFFTLSCLSLSSISHTPLFVYLFLSTPPTFVIFVCFLCSALDGSTNCISVLLTVAIKLTLVVIKAICRDNTQSCRHFILL